MKNHILIIALLITNLAWIVATGILSTAVISMVKSTTYLSTKYLSQSIKLTQDENEHQHQIALRDSKISNLLSSTLVRNQDVVDLAEFLAPIYSTAHTPDQIAFLHKALPEAIRLQLTQGIPASACLAQAILESSYGTSKLAREFNNFHGIKASGNWKGPQANMLSLENGTTPLRSDFRVYSQLEDGFEGYAEFLKNNQRYQSAFQTFNGLEFVQAAVTAGYCSDPGYLSSIKQIFLRHNLSSLDRLFTSNDSSTLHNNQ